VRRIFIQGAEQISPSEVRKEMRLRQKVWWKPFQKNYLYGPDHLESDLTRILTLYHNEGFIFARIDEATVSYQSRDWVDIEIQVTEGARVYVAGAELVGPGGEDAARLREKIKIRPGEPLMEHLLARDENRLLEACHEMGRALAEVTRETRVREDSARVCYHVAVGPLVRLGEIDIAGLTRTKEPIVRRELVLKTGEIFRISRAARTQERLYDLGLFRSVRIEPTYQERRRLTEPPREVEVDLTLDVVERPPGSYGFGLGYTSNDRIRLSGDWQYNNLGGLASEHPHALAAPVPLQLQALVAHRSDPRREHLRNRDVRRVGVVALPQAHRVAGESMDRGGFDRHPLQGVRYTADLGLAPRGSPRLHPRPAQRALREVQERARRWSPRRSGLLRALDRQLLALRARGRRVHVGLPPPRRLRAPHRRQRTAAGHLAPRSHPLRRSLLRRWRDHGEGLC
jgi:hypothetical protein